MKLHFAQIGAMAFYETRMLWRQRMLIVFTLSTLVLTGVLLIALRVADGASHDASFVESNTVQWITMFWPLLYFQLLVLSGVTVVDVMPRDRLWNVKPILDGTPLPRLTYLLGKLGGAWLAIVLSLIVILIGAGVMGWWAIGPYELRPYLQMCLAGAMPLAILHVGLCLMLAAFAPTRRWAVVLVLLFSLGCSMLSSINIRLIDLNVWGLLNPGRPYLYNYFWLGWIDRAFNTPLGAHVIGVSLGIGLLELIACGMLVWWWLRWREGRE